MLVGKAKYFGYKKKILHNLHFLILCSGSYQRRAGVFLDVAIRRKKHKCMLYGHISFFQRIFGKYYLRPLRKRITFFFVQGKNRKFLFFLCFTWTISMNSKESCPSHAKGLLPKPLQVGCIFKWTGSAPSFSCALPFWRPIFENAKDTVLQTIWSVSCVMFNKPKLLRFISGATFGTK